MPEYSRYGDNRQPGKFNPLLPNRLSDAHADPGQESSAVGSVLNFGLGELQRSVGNRAVTYALQRLSLGSSQGPGKPVPIQRQVAPLTHQQISERVAEASGTLGPTDPRHDQPHLEHVLASLTELTRRSSFHDLSEADRTAVEGTIARVQDALEASLATRGPQLSMDLGGRPNNRGGPSISENHGGGRALTADERWYANPPSPNPMAANFAEYTGSQGPPSAQAYDMMRHGGPLVGVGGTLAMVTRPGDPETQLQIMSTLALGDTAISAPIAHPGHNDPLPSPGRQAPITVPDPDLTNPVIHEQSGPPHIAPETIPTGPVATVPASVTEDEQASRAAAARGIHQHPMEGLGEGTANLRRAEEMQQRIETRRRVNELVGPDAPEFPTVRGRPYTGVDEVRGEMDRLRERRNWLIETIVKLNGLREQFPNSPHDSSTRQTLSLLQTQLNQGVQDAADLGFWLDHYQRTHH